MSDEIQTAIRGLQSADDSQVQRAFATIAHLARRDPDECAAALSRAVLAEQAAGGLRTPRLLTLLGLTGVAVPECLPVSLDLLRALASTKTPPPADAALGAAAIVARTQPRALLPDLAAVQAGPQAAPVIDREMVRAVRILLSVTSDFLEELPDSAFTEMARRLWHDCAGTDLMTLVDFTVPQVEKSGADDPIIGLIVDLLERLPASADQKRYAGQRLQEAGVGRAVVEQLQNAWRAIRVAPAPDPATAEQSTVLDPDPPAPEPRLDEWLALFGEGDEIGVEMARAAIDEIFEEMHPPVALAWWVALTVDGLPPARRQTDINWALVQFATMLRKHGKAMVPPSLLQRWLDTPQLLNPTDTMIALDLLGQQQPGFVVHHWLHRAVAASNQRHVRMVLGDMWRQLATADPYAILRVASRWIAFGFGESPLLELCSRC
jgi:hypothetical protein